MTDLTCFKAYDIRGRVDENVTPGLAHALGLALAQVMGVTSVVLGHDMRATSPALKNALADGLQAAGVSVLDLGLCGTEEVYFGVNHLQACAGVMVTASHNPIEYNGFKIVGPKATPLPDQTFAAIKQAVIAGPENPGLKGCTEDIDYRDAYARQVISFVDPKALGPLHILTNAGNGAAGPTFDAVMQALTDAGADLTITRLHHDGDPTFPNGIPNPLLPENQPVTGDAVRAAGADMGIAWDGDFDRCFFFDATGGFVPGEYMVGLLAEAVLAKNPGSAIVHDGRVIWNTQRVVAAAGGRSVASKTGHAFMKADMRANHATYGGEMSAHHYFRDFMYCDSGMIPWILLAAHMSATGRSLKDLVADMRARHPSSGEINFRVTDTDAARTAILAQFGPDATSRDDIDGLSLAFDTWRMNVRASNTEPLLRLNVEGTDTDTVAAKTKAVSDYIRRLA